MAEQQEQAKEELVAANQPAHRDREEEQKAETAAAPTVVDDDVPVKADSPAVEPRDSADEPPAAPAPPPDDKVAEERPGRVASPASPSASRSSPPAQSPAHDGDACEPNVESNAAPSTAKEPDDVGHDDRSREEPTATVAVPGERSRSTSPATVGGKVAEEATTEEKQEQEEQEEQEEEENVAAAKQDLPEKQTTDPTAAAAAETGEAAAAVAMEADDVEHRVPQAGDDADRHGNSQDAAATAPVVQPGAAVARAEHDEKKRKRHSPERSNHSSEEGADGGRSRSCSTGGSSSDDDDESTRLVKKVKLDETAEKDNESQQEAGDHHREEPKKQQPQGVEVNSLPVPGKELSATDDGERRRDSVSAPPSPRPVSVPSEQDAPSSNVMEHSGETENVSPRPAPSPTPPTPAPVAPVAEAPAVVDVPALLGREPVTVPPKPVAVPLPLPKDVKKAGGGLVSKIPLDTGRLEADLQYAKRQLADVRSKYDVTRKELHATKRKLKRITARMNGGNAGTGSGSSGSGPGSGGNSPQGAGGGAPASSDDDRNRKWREPMILSAMKIKAAMGIQAYKSLIKDGELLLPSLRTITRYLESLRKASSSGGGITGGAGEQLGGAPLAAAIGSCAMVVDDDDGDDDDEEDDGRREDRQGKQQHQMVARGGPVGHKGAKTGVNGSRRVVDHNRNEQRQRGDPALESAVGAGAHQLYHRSHHYPHHGPRDVQEVDQMSRQIKTEHDPVSFTASPDINYYQHNADDDEDDDEDGYQNPASLLQDSCYGVGAATGDGNQAGGHYNQHASNQQQQQPPQQQQTLSQTQIEFLKSMVGFRKKWTPYELRMCNDVRRIIGSREYDSLRKNDGMPLPSVKTLRKYRHAAPLEDVDAIGRKRKLHEALDDSSCQPQIGTPYGGGGAGDDGRLFSYGRSAKRRLKAEHDPDGQFDARMLTLAQISFLQTLSLNTKGFSDYELQRSLELKNELGCKNYELLRQQEFLNIPTLAMLTRYEQDNGLEDLSRYAEAAAEEEEEPHDEADGGGGDGGDHRQQQQQQQEVDEQQAREQQQQLELYNRLTQADPARHPLFDSIADDSPPGEGTGGGGGDHPGNVTAAAIAAAMVAAAAGLNPLDLNGGSGGGGGTGDDSSLSIFEHHSIFDKDTPSFDMTKLSPAHVEFLNTLPENPKRWTQEMINSALDIKNEIGTRDYEILRRQGIPLPAARTLRRHKDIRSKADRVGGEPGELLPPRSGATTPAPAGIVGSG
ncbi:uncharacterized protein LOC131207166 [Anopheles bellator]|uniref:uncharacterized protein LOC131207166 n=1 Tax=Anopheles bellator TaxID=139047 RepID=UPI0026472929|nr:uncharacterized protein LOC131207166 [Anopheles bellator]